MRLDPDDIEAVALRVAELVRDQIGEGARYVDAAALARILGVERNWVYARARQLEAVRLGDGPRAPLRFDLRRVRKLLAVRDGRQPRPAEPTPRRRGRPRKSALPPGVKPVRARPSR